MNRPLSNKSSKWHNFLQIPVATSEFLEAKFRDHRVYTIRMLWLSAAVSSGLWIWDYVHDPVNSPDTWLYRILMGLPFAASAIYITFSKPSRKIIQWIIIASSLLSTASFFKITTMVQGAMISSNEGYMLFQISVLLILQSSSFPMVIVGHIANTMIPHLLAFVFPGTGFSHIKYGILLWPVTIATLIAQFYMYAQFGQNWRLRQRLEEMASHDTLTGFLNRRAFQEHAVHLITLAKRHWNQYLSVLMVDADYFKQINDNYGHETGDRVLCELSKTISENLRGTDLQCRWGGEEFLILMPETESAGAGRIAQRLLQAVRSLHISVEENKLLSLTVSIGIAELKHGDEELDTLINRADNALYLAKSLGRDRAEYAK